MKPSGNLAAGLASPLSPAQVERPRLTLAPPGLTLGILSFALAPRRGLRDVKQTGHPSQMRKLFHPLVGGLVGFAAGRISHDQT